jgi:hypothetical protein
MVEKINNKNMDTNNLNQTNKPEDWLNSTLIFGRALSFMLDENQGIVVNITDDVTLYDGKVNKVIVYYKDGMIQIIECEQDLKEGTIVIISNS